MWVSGHDRHVIHEPDEHGMAWCVDCQSYVNTAPDHGVRIGVEITADGDGEKGANLVVKIDG